MKLKEYLSEKISYIITHFTVAMITGAILWALIPIGSLYIIVLVEVPYIVGACIPLVIEFNKKRVFYNNLIFVFENFDRKTLVAELVKAPDFREGIILYDVLKGTNKAYLEEINKYKNMQEEYRQYIELWVHEVKTPIASTKLLIQNNKNKVTSSILEEIEKIERYVEQTMFYSKLNSVEKDYIIKEVKLHELCNSVIKKNSKDFIQKNISVVTENLDVTAFCDTKWLEYIVNQIVINAIKYSNKNGAKIVFEAAQFENSVVLTIEDNGIGIPESDIGRIFDKGFTGINGRAYEKTSGMGLYICKMLCDKLGLFISAESQKDSTKIRITLPKNSMTEIV